MYFRSCTELGLHSHFWFLIFISDSIRLFEEQLISSDPHNVGDVELVIYEIWEAGIHRIASIDSDTFNVTLSNSFSCSYAETASGSRRFYWQNMYETLDSPGAPQSLIFTN